MNKTCRLLCCCLLVLVICSHSATPAANKDEPIETFTTVKARREHLTVLSAEREQAYATGDEVAVIQLTNRIVELYLKQCDFETALTQSKSSLELARSAARSGDVKLLVDTLILTARVHISRTESATALPLLKEALTLSVDLGYRKGQAQSQTELASAYYELDERNEAELSNDEALRMWQELQDKRGEAQVLMMQGYLFMLDNRNAESSAALKSAELIWRSLNNPAELANALIDQNFLAVRQGQWHNALVLLNEAQALVIEKEAEPFLAGKLAMSLGEIYEAYGQLDTALSYFTESLNHYQEGARDIKGAIDARMKVGRVQASLGDYVAAKAQLEQSLATAFVTRNNLTIGLCHESLGRVLLEEGSHAQARQKFLAAISYFTKSQSARPLARTEIYLGQTEYLLGNLTRASESYEKALRFFNKHSDYTNEAAVRFGLGKLALEERRLERAGEHLRRSIELTERLRENASSKELRSSFLHSIHDRYETYVEWLMSRYSRDRNQQDAIAAFEAAESGRARALLDSLYNYQRELRQPSDPLLLFEEEKLQKQEQQLVDERARLLSRGGTDEERSDVEQKLREVRAQSETLDARIKSSAKFNDLLRPNPLSYDSIRTSMSDAQTSLLSYSLGSAKSFAWVVTETGLSTYELADKRTIEVAALQLVERLKTPPTNTTEQTQLQTAIDEVSSLVLQPVSEKLRTPRLIIVADGILQYVPFNILNANAIGKEPMISSFDVVQMPSASALALVRRQRMNRQAGSKLLIGFGDAVFSPEYSPHTPKVDTISSEVRSKQRSRFSNLSRLFYAKRELRAIGQLTGNDSVFYVEHNASRDRLLSVDLSQYRILHVVTHGVLDDQRPELSGLVLSMVDDKLRPVDGFVSLADIYKMRAPVDLVVLSACHTALGQNLRGEGLIGLTRGFMYAGASGVVASLWKVDDRATAELMQHFYSNMLQHGMGPAAALRAAQNEIRSQSKWSSPYYWAGFTFQGDYDLKIIAERPVAHSEYKWLMAGISLVLTLTVIGYWFLRHRRSRSD